ncbi:MAG: dephospho-CoA kinase [Gammaproteobacteria bacterium]|nr:dephospho-CoA kinase [Gammaproteobacteria bacterium]
MGLTGGLACGKTTACRYLQRLGVPTVDADELSREVVLPGSSGLQQLLDYFGDAILQPQGSLNRPYLAKRVFSSTTDRVAVEKILHPLILQKIREWSATITTPYAIIAAPLLFEARWQSEVDHILVIDLPREEQIKRAESRDQRSRQEIEAILDSQWSRQQRVAAADTTIANSGLPKELEKRLLHFHQRLLKKLKSTNLPQ